MFNGTGVGYYSSNMLAYALTANQFANRLLENIVEPLVVLMAFIAILIFIGAAIRFINKADSSEQRAGMFKSMGIIIFGIFVIFSIWTIFSFVGRLANSEIDIREDRAEFGQYELLRRNSPGSN